MKSYDVIVVGAGPAGATAARACAACGCSVLLVDKATFPRDKPCGGGVNARAARLLPFPMSEVAARAASGIRFRKGSFEATGVADAPITYLIDRAVFDLHLVECAVAAGATLRERAPVRELTQERGHVVVRAGAETFTGRTVVAADGANGRSARLAGISTRHRLGVAMEARFAVPPSFLKAWKGLLGVDLGVVRGGFGWVFPKDDHVNLGVGGWAQEAPTLRRHLAKLALSHGLDPRRAEEVKSHPLPIRRSSSVLGSDRVVLVGDAAGLVDPLSGEGIYTAIASGGIAAERIVAELRGDPSALDGYSAAIEATLGRELALGLELHDALHLAPAAFFFALRCSPRIWKQGFALLRGDASLDDLVRGLGLLRPPLAVLAAIGRAVRLVHEGRAARRRRSACAAPA